MIKHSHGDGVDRLYKNCCNRIIGGIAMKRLCFGTLMHILYQARNQKVTNNLLCDAIL